MNINSRHYINMKVVQPDDNGELEHALHVIEHYISPEPVMLLRENEEIPIRCALIPSSSGKRSSGSIFNHREGGSVRKSEYVLYYDNTKVLSEMEHDSFFMYVAGEHDGEGVRAESDRIMFRGEIYQLKAQNRYLAIGGKYLCRVDICLFKEPLNDCNSCDLPDPLGEAVDSNSEDGIYKL